MPKRCHFATISRQADPRRSNARHAYARRGAEAVGLRRMRDWITVVDGFEACVGSPTRLAGAHLRHCAPMHRSRSGTDEPAPADARADFSPGLSAVSLRAYPAPWCV